MWRRLYIFECEVLSLEEGGERGERGEREVCVFMVLICLVLLVYDERLFITCVFYLLCLACVEAGGVCLCLHEGLCVTDGDGDWRGGEREGG